MTMSVTVHYSLDENVLLLLLRPVMRLVMKLQLTGMPGGRTGTVWGVWLRNAALQIPAANAAPPNTCCMFAISHTNISRVANRSACTEERWLKSL